MRHQVQKARLKRARGPRRLLLKNLATSLVLHEKIQTTQAKAKALQPVIDKLIRSCKKGNKTMAIREINKLMQSELASKKVMENLTQRFQNKQGGFTRIINIGFRAGDAAPLVQIELT